MRQQASEQLHELYRFQAAAHVECDKEEELLSVIKRLQDDHARAHAELVEERRARRQLLQGKRELDAQVQTRVYMCVCVCVCVSRSLSLAFSLPTSERLVLSHKLCFP